MIEHHTHSDTGDLPWPNTTQDCHEPTAYDRAIAYAAETGAANGYAAATWVIDGNTSQATARAILAGIDDGDPAVLDTFPQADLSGQWADTLTGPDLVYDALAAAGVSAEDDPDAGEDGLNWFSAICDAYEQAFSEAVEAEISRAARYIIGD